MQPSSGKSTTLNSLTDASSKVGMFVYTVIKFVAVLLQTTFISQGTSRKFTQVSAPVDESLRSLFSRLETDNGNSVSPPSTLSVQLDTSRSSVHASDTAFQIGVSRTTAGAWKDGDPCLSNF